MKFKRLFALTTMIIGFCAFGLTANAQEITVNDKTFETDNASQTIEIGMKVNAYYFEDEKALLVAGEGETFDYTELSTHSKSPFYNKFDGRFDVYVSDGVTYLGQSLFDQMNVNDVYLGKDVESMGEKVFYLSKISTFDAANAEQLDSLPEQCFYGCESLKEIILPNEMKYIDDITFAGTSSLTKITLPISCDVSGGSLGTNITEIHFTKGTGIGADYLSEAGLKLPWNKNKNSIVTLEEGITYIGTYMFYENPMKEIKLPTTLEEIGNAAFTRSEISKITIPKAVKKIGNDAFANCPNLTCENVTFEGNIEDISKMDTSFDFELISEEESTESTETESVHNEQKNTETEDVRGEQETTENNNVLIIMLFVFGAIILVLLLIILRGRRSGTVQVHDGSESVDIEEISYYSDEEEPTKESEKVCPVCGEAVKQGKKFCTKCGTKV